MKTPFKLTILLLLFILAACSSPSTAEPAIMTEADKTMADDAMADEAMTDDAMADDAMADEHMADETMADDTMADDVITDDHMADETMTDETMTDDAMADDHIADETMTDETMTDDVMMDERPAWQKITLTDVRTNETFTLADFAGKTVYVEPMATWCTNCRRQLGYVQEARAQLNDENVVFIGISVETNIDNATLSEYTVNTGFDWPFAVATPEMLQLLAEQFGRTIVNPPSTPHFVISPDGTFGELVTGFETPEEIIARLQG